MTAAATLTPPASLLLARPAADAVSRTLDLARWAPSGDNAQPWRFQREDHLAFRIDTRDQSRDCVYERDGRCGLISIGILLETIRLATSISLSARVAKGPRWTARRSIHCARRSGWRRSSGTRVAVKLGARGVAVEIRAQRPARA